MDLLDFFRQVHPWGKLYRLLDHLPWWSQYKLLLADDDEVAQAVHGTGHPKPTSQRPPVAQWNPVAEMIAEVRDAASRIEAAVANANRAKGTKAVRPKPALRPITAAQRVELRAERAQHQDIVQKMLPRG